MLNRLLSICILVAAFSAKGQLVHEFDTLLYGERINSSIDSVDISGSDLPTTFDGGYSILSTKGLSTNTLFNQYTDLNFLRLGRFDKMRFSALPHLGFAYSFGGQGAQFMQAVYEHAFLDSTVLNIAYNRNTGTGILRNSAFTNNNVKVQFQHMGKRFSTQLKGEYVAHTIGHPGGLDSLSNNGLEFSFVNKSDANSVSKAGQVRLMNYLNVLPDSTNALGIMSHHYYSILNRVYTETGDLNAIYDTTFIDSTSTRDQFNLASITNGAGVYFSNPLLYIHGLIDYTYWKYQNLGANYDSTELDLTSHAALTLPKIVLTNDLKFNFLGRFNEFSNRVGVRYRGDKLNASASFLYENKAPTVFQRRYFANNSNYILTSFDKQNWLRVRAGVDYALKNEKIAFAAYGDFASISDVYYFNGSRWAIDSLTANFASVGVKSKMSFGIFNFHPHVVYSIDQNGYLPNFQAYARLFIKGRLFKAKKLEALVGIDASYITSFKTRAFIPTMDTYDWWASTSTFQPVANLHAFLSIGIADFRFYFRYENIGSFWNDVDNDVVLDYPMAQTRMRIGITWDFFN